MRNLMNYFVKQKLITKYIPIINQISIKKKAQLLIINNFYFITRNELRIRTELFIFKKS